jgi:uncharacterized protein (DUF2062 family)
MIGRIIHSILQFFKSIYTRLVAIHDTPQKIAQGFGLGVFLGIVPGVGPIASLVLATILKMNRAAALLGSLLTNTWLSVITFFMAVKVGSAAVGIDWKNACQSWSALDTNAGWLDLFKLSAIKIAAPVMLGYLIISLLAGLLAYLMALGAVLAVRRKPQLHP